MSDELQLYLALGYCLFMYILLKVLIRYTPKKINQIYGYRTPRSMKNQDTWEEGNRYANEYMMKISLWSFIFPALGFFLFPQQVLVVTIVGNSVLLILVIFLTEKYLSNLFDKDGNRK